MKYYVEKGSGYEFGVEGEKLYITKSPRRKSTSRKNKQEVKKGAKAYESIYRFLVSSGHEFTKNISLEKENGSNKKSQDDDSKPGESNIDKQRSLKTKTDVKSKATPQQANKKQPEKAVKQSTEKIDTLKEYDPDKINLPNGNDNIKSLGMISKNFSEIKFANWLSLDYDEVKFVVFGGKKYKSIGAFKDPESGKMGVSVYLTFEDFKKIKNVTKAQVKPMMEPYKMVKPDRGTIDMKKYWKRGPVKNYYFIPWGTAAITLILERVNFKDEAALADVIQSAFDIGGMIPGYGAPFDIANGGIELSKPEPNYYLSMLYFLGGVLAVGELLSVLRMSKAIPNIAKGVPASKAAFKTALGFTSDISTVQQIGKLTRGTSAVEKLIKGCNIVIDNMTDIVKFLEKIGLVIDPQKIKAFEAYVQAFSETYKAYKNLKPVKMLTNFKNLVAFASRPTNYVLDELYRDSITNLVNDTYYKIASVEPSGSIEADAINIAVKLSENLGELNEKEIKMYIALVDILEDVEIQSKQKVTAENRIITETTLKKIIKQKLLISR